MKVIHVAVGSLRRPKLNAVREALDLVVAKLEREARFEIVGRDVPSGVPHTPLTRDHMMLGARRRAEALLQIARDSNEPWTYFVGLEGGVEIVYECGNRWVFLENWAYVCDAGGHGAFGQSGAVLLPEGLARRVVDDGEELAQAVDAFAGAVGIRDAQGAWGVLTKEIITRQEAFRIATINAFSPLLNRELYGRL